MLSSKTTELSSTQPPDEAMESQEHDTMESHDQGLKSHDPGSVDRGGGGGSGPSSQAAAQASRAGVTLAQRNVIQSLEVEGHVSMINSLN